MPETVLQGNTRGAGQRATENRQAHYSKKWSWALFFVILFTLPVFFGVGYAIFDPAPKKSPELEDQMRAPSCQDVAEIPSGRTGDFCRQMKAEIPTGLIKPPPATAVSIRLNGPGEIRFFDWYEKQIGVVHVDGPEGQLCYPAGWISVTILMKKDGDSVRMRVGGTSLPVSGTGIKCSS